MLAEKLGRRFIELDEEIAGKAGKSIPDIFRQDGEIRFRELEIEAVKKIAGKKNAVIACGGGAVLNSINVFRLKQECVIVCLTAPPEVIIQRTSADKDGRPLLSGTDREERVKELLEYRRPFYQRAADITVDTSGADVPGVVGKIIGALNGYESHD